MMIDGKKTIRSAIPIHWGYRGIAEDAGRTALMTANQLSPAVDRSERVHAGVQGIPGEAREGMRRTERERRRGRGEHCSAGVACGT